MAITQVNHGDMIYYTALSNDPQIISNNFGGGIIGAKVYITDVTPTMCKIINPDSTLSDFTMPVSGVTGGGGTSGSVTINDATTTANTLKVNADGSINVNADITAQVGDIEIKNDAGNPIPTSAIDGGISTVGLKADSAMTVSTNPTTVIGGLKGIFNKLGSVILGSGSAIIGKVGIDQTAGQNTITVASGQSIGITGTPTVNISAGQNVGITGTPTFNVGTMPNVNINLQAFIPAKITLSPGVDNVVKSSAGYVAIIQTSLTDLQLKNASTIVWAGQLQGSAYPIRLSSNITLSSVTGGDVYIAYL